MTDVDEMLAAYGDRLSRTVPPVSAAEAVGSTPVANLRVRPVRALVTVGVIVVAAVAGAALFVVRTSDRRPASNVVVPVTSTESTIPTDVTNGSNNTTSTSTSSQLTTAATTLIESLGPLPIDAAMNRPLAQRQLVGDAVELATKECMATAGYTYIPRDFPVDASTFFDLIIAGRHGLVDPDVAVSAGYFNSRNVPDSTPFPSDGRPTNPTEQAGFDAALDGSPANPPISIDQRTMRIMSGGCRQVAADQIWGSNDAATAEFDVIQTLSSEATSTVSNSAGFVALNQQWSACMQSSGYTYADPRAANVDWSTKRSAQPDRTVATSEESAVAIADVACKTTVGYIATLDGMYAVVEQSLAAAQAQDIDTYVQHFNDAALTASAYINSH